MLKIPEEGTALGLEVSGKVLQGGSCSLSGEHTDNDANLVVTRVTFGLEDWAFA